VNRFPLRAGDTLAGTGHIWVWMSFRARIVPIPHLRKVNKLALKNARGHDHHFHFFVRELQYNREDAKDSTSESTCGAIDYINIQNCTSYKKLIEGKALKKQ
jgi:hypothetical protein